MLRVIERLAVIILRIQFYILLLIVFGLYSCGQKKSTIEDSKSRLKLKFEVIPEDSEKYLYSIEWKDTLGQSEGYINNKWFTRPKEIWCMITNNQKDTLGYYRGLSTAQTFAYFQSTDTIVTLNFMIGLNFFSDKFGNGKDMVEFENNARQYSKDNRLPIVFESIKLNLQTDLRKKHEIELKEKLLPLQHSQ